jgi:S-DNA-T family DNA segregation ATPase FtsK/SpoIIIE
MDLDKKNKLIKDIVLLFFIFLIIFFALSIFSYSKTDPSFSNIVFSNYENQLDNIFGKLGAFIADVLGSIFGWSALLIPFFLSFVAFRFFQYRIGKTEKYYDVIFSVFLSIFLLIFISLISGFTKTNDFYFINKSSGGVIGGLASDFLVPLVGTIGGVLIVLFFILVFSMLLFKVSIFDIKNIIKLANIRKFPKSEKKEKKVIEKKKKVKKKEKIIKEEPEIIEDFIDIEENKLSSDDIIVKEPLKDAEKAKVKYQIPLDLLDEINISVDKETEDELKVKAKLLEQKLADFGVNGKIRDIQPGPVVTQFQFEPAPGIKVSKIANLENDLALAMSALSVRIIAPIPGKSVVGIELPNKSREVVSLKEMLNTKLFADYDSKLVFAMGKDISGAPYITDICTMPHLLIAGTTGSGKSVAVNTMICSIVYKASPKEVKFVMIDPKMVELSVYEGIPHLAAPVVTDPRKAAAVLKNVVKEMEERYALLAEHRVRNLDSFNALADKTEDLERMPYIVVIVDEFADLMIVAGKEVENSIIRIAQMARAVGIHLILATQRPSVNVITGIIKANMPSRLSFRVSSKTDSRTILDQNGAELLLGKGDSLFVPPGSSDTIRVHGCFVSEGEVANIVDYLKTIGEPEYNMELLKEEDDDSEAIDESEMDDKYYEALEFIKTKDQASISMIQRHLRIGYNRAARIIEIMERQGVVAPSDGTSRPREVLLKD